MGEHAQHLVPLKKLRQKRQVYYFFKVYAFKSLLYPGPLQVCCGQAGVKGKYKIVNVPSEAEFKHITNCPPKDAAKFSLKLLSVFFYRGPASSVLLH